MKMLLWYGGIAVAIYVLFVRKGAPYGYLIPESLIPSNGAGPQANGGTASRSTLKKVTDLGVAGACMYATGGAAAPLCAAGAPFATDVYFKLWSAEKKVATTVAKGAVTGAKKVASGAKSVAKAIIPGW